jgi:hypothetical protein
MERNRRVAQAQDQRVKNRLLAIKDEQFEVASVVLAFDHGELIKKLIERGEKIKEEEWKEAKEIENEISKEYLTNEEELKKLRTPKSAYITLKDEG